MTIPLNFASEALVEQLRQDGYRIIGQVVGGQCCLIARKGR